MKDGQDRNGKATEADERPRIYFICLGQPNLDLNKRVKRLATHGDALKQIRRKCLRCSTRTTSLGCNLYDQKFSNVMYLQRHAIDVYLTVT